MEKNKDPCVSSEDQNHKHDRPCDVSDASSDASFSSLTRRTKKFDVKNFVDCPFPEEVKEVENTKVKKESRKKDKQPVNAQEETVLDYFKNIPASGINLTDSTSDIVKKLVKHRAESTLERRRRPKLRCRVKRFPTVEEDTTNEDESGSTSTSSSGSYGSFFSSPEEIAKEEAEKKLKEAEENGKKEIKSI